MRRSSLGLAVVLVTATTSAFFAGAGCGSGGSPSTFVNPDAGRDTSTLPDAPVLVPDVPQINLDANQTYSDFPQAPIIDAPEGGVAAPSGSPGLFGSADAGASADGGAGGPCLVEPEINSLYPQNWLRPRFHWLAANGENLFELRLHVQNQANDLVVYTASNFWTMPLDMWTSLAAHSADKDMTIAVRGGVYDPTSMSLSGLADGSSGPLGIAPVQAPGSIVYWTTTNASLKGFTIGDESVVQVLVPSQVQEQSTTCIGCHTSTPDGLFASFSVPTNNWSNAIASVQQATVGQPPSFLGAGGKAAIEQSYRGINTFSKAHWTSGDHVEVVGFTGVLSWVDLEDPTAGSMTASGAFTRTGDSRLAGAPTWSHDGSTIVYVSTNAIVDGRLDNGDADLYSIPYANKAGGTATPLLGASDPNYEEYYPVYSPDDRLLAFNRIAPGLNMYNQPAAEVFVIPAQGGTATRLSANDPPACTGKMSPGITNSWPKWAPSTGTSDGRTFYWLVFSSARDEMGNPQLYITPVVVDAQGNIKTYGALYLWNQPSDENNHTPAWDYFMIPMPPPR